MTYKLTISYKGHLGKKPFTVICDSWDEAVELQNLLTTNNLIFHSQIEPPKLNKHYNNQKQQQQQQYPIMPSVNIHDY